MSKPQLGGGILDTRSSLVTTTLPPLSPDAVSTVTIPQYSRRAIFAIWAAVSLPMAVLVWIVAPPLASSFDGPEPLFRSLLILITAGLFWQFVLVMALVGLEQRSLRWSTLRDALWLRSPRSPRTGRIGGKTWLITLPLIVGVGLEELIPQLPHPANREFGAIIDSDAGRAFLHGAWGWFALIIVMFILNTVIGEELLFRGFLLPRMNGAFGDRDWLANGLLFATYHLHVWWVIPQAALVDTFVLSYASKRYGSAWIGIVVHSAQSVFLGILLLTLVL
jgi:membrane protease YdiL (CAAX protease family)